MNSAEEDIQATAMRQRSLVAHAAYHFRARTVLRVAGDLAGLSDIATGPAPDKTETGRFVSLLEDNGHLGADIFVVPHQEGYLIDVHADLADAVANQLEALDGVREIDRSAAHRWRVLGELPNQKGAESPFETMRFADNRRRELGARVLRDAAEPEGLDWRHARKWDVHAMKLGILPDHRCIQGLEIKPKEAGYHRLGRGKSKTATETPPLERRVLPVRVEPNQPMLPVMTGAKLLAGENELGMMLDQEGLYGIALVSIEPWRAALGNARRITCLDEPVLIAWPTWLSTESEGRYGPAGHVI